MFPPT